MSLRDEIDEFMNARLDESPDVVKARESLRPGVEALDTMENVQLVSSIVGVHREAILRLADEIDKLRQGTEG